MVPDHETIVNTVLCGMFLSKVTASLCEILTKETELTDSMMSPHLTKKTFLEQIIVNRYHSIRTSLLF